MQFNPSNEWSKLSDAIIEELQSTPIADFISAWKTPKAKTAFYGRFFKAVAEHIGCKLLTEFLRCDFVITNTFGIPIAFIESENAHGSATQEIEKLCATSAPIKILLMSCEWSDSERAIWFGRWRERIALQHTYFGSDCIYVIIVGEWGRGRTDDGILRYLFDVIDHRGVEINRLEIVLPGKSAEPSAVGS